MKTSIFIIGMVISIIYIGFGVLLFVTQRSFIYFPSQVIQHPFDEITFDNNGNTIKSILLNKGKKNAIVYFGGNAEAVAYSAGEFNNQFNSHTVYLVNYRGYGGSSGSPSEASLYSDAIHIFDLISVSHESITIIGRSLGSGVACYLAAQRNVEKLVLITPFDSIQNIAQNTFPIYPMSLLLKDKYNSIDKASKIQAKVLILVAEKDEVIGMMHTKNLASSFSNGTVETIVIKGAGHNNISEYPRHYESIKEFIKSGQGQ